VRFSAEILRKDATCFADSASRDLTGWKWWNWSGWNINELLGEFPSVYPNPCGKLGDSHPFLRIHDERGFIAAA
jgi:hypothetical protein